MRNTKQKVSQLLAAEPNLSAFVTLFSFGTIARAAQFLVPLLIYALFPPSEDLDFYFYWTTQSNLIASFLSAIWPNALMSILIKAREKHDDSLALGLASAMFRRFLFGVLLMSGITAILAYLGMLGGPIATPSQPSYSLLGLMLTISCNALALALAEIGTASRRFGIGFIGLLVGAFAQLFVLILVPTASGLILSFLIGALSQLITTAWLLGHGFKRLLLEVLPPEQRQKVLSLFPSPRMIALLFLGGFFTLLSSHFSMRLLPQNEVGTVSAFALATMLAFAPQQLVIQHLSTICGVALAEAYHSSNQQFARLSAKWRSRLFGCSIWFALAMSVVALSAMEFLPILAEFLNLSGQSIRSYSLVAAMGGFLCVPLAISGLNTWNARVTVSVERIEAGIWYQVASNSLTIALLFWFSQYPGPFSSPLALAVAALIQLISIPLYQRLILARSLK